MNAEFGSISVQPGGGKWFAYLLIGIIVIAVLEANAFVATVQRGPEVLQLIAEGKPNKQVAAELGVSFKTVDKHRQRVMRKLGMRIERNPSPEPHWLQVVGVLERPPRAARRT